MRYSEVDSACVNLCLRMSLMLVCLPEGGNGPSSMACLGD